MNKDKEIKNRNREYRVVNKDLQYSIISSVKI